MDTDRRLAAMTKSEALHEHVMAAVVSRMQDTPYVLKGGTALAFAYDLDRHSTDIDFDAAEPVYIKDRIRHGLADAGVSLAAFLTAKDTPIGQRYKVHYIDPDTHEDCLMNVDMSFRTVPNEDDISDVRGIRTYKIEALFDQKLLAAVQRTAGRDLFDLAFMARRFGDILSNDQIRRTEEFSRDYEGIAGFFDQAFRSDVVLSRFSTAEDRALMLRIAIEEQIARRRLGVAEQAMPGDASLAQALALHGIWLASSGQEGCRADLRGYRFTGMNLCGMNFERADLEGSDFTDANLRDANLRGADLRQAVFNRTDLTGADVTGADLEGVTLAETRLGPTTKGVGEALAIAHAKSPASRPVRIQRDDARIAEPEVEIAR